METRWRIELFGGLQVVGGDETLTRFVTQKTGALLAYLAYYLHRSHPREVLIDLLWPESEPRAGRGNLSQALYGLRHALEPAGVPAGSVIVADRTSVRLDPGSVTTDVAQFEAATRSAARAGSSTERAHWLADAVERYRAPLLAGYYETWIVGEQERLNALYFGALGELLTLLEAAGDLDRALEYARRGVAVDPLREEGHRALMRLLAAAGEPGAVLRQYRQLERLLKQELDLTPTAATSALARDLDRSSSHRPPRSSPSLQPETAHVLFIEPVECSPLPMETRAGLMRALQDLVRGTAEARGAKARGALIHVPAGEGTALVFFGDAAAPIRCALEITRILRREDPSCSALRRDGAPLRLRMGVHSGPVDRGPDANASRCVSGEAIQTARRVTECGDAGHILLSPNAGRPAEQPGDWPVTVDDLGECEIRAGMRLQLFNLYTDELGNPERPSKLRRGLPSATRPSGGSPATAPDGAVRVALLYKRDAVPDERLLRLLEARLAACGHRVFVDRHVPVGIAWAAEIERQLRTADAVIPLLSAASVGSEMLAYELQIAHEAAQQQQGRPWLLPLRVSYAGPLPKPLAGILDPIEYVLWEGPQDDERVVTELLSALQHPAPPSSGTLPGLVVPWMELEPAGGAVPLDSAFYVVRPTDGEFRAALARRDSIVLVKGVRQMGKTSLLARGLQQAREAGARIVLSDFQKLNRAHLESVEALFLTLAQSMAVQLDLNVLPHERWDPCWGPSTNFERYLRCEVLGKLPGPIVWGLDDVDRLFTCDYATDVFGLLRSWHNARSFEPAGPWSRLTLAITYATEAHLFLSDLNQSPFNVGTRLLLEDFTLEQVADLNRRYGSPLRNDAEIARFYQLVGGHPDLVRRGLHAMVARRSGIASLEAEAACDAGIFADHLRRMLMLLARDPELSEVVREVLRGRPCPTAESFYRLRSAGVMAGDSAREVRPRCRLYATYLERHLS